MLGIFLVLIMFFWLLMGPRKRMAEKVIISSLVVLGCIYYLSTIGATKEQILDIIFSFQQI